MSKLFIYSKNIIRKTILFPFKTIDFEEQGNDSSNEIHSFTARNLAEEYSVSTEFAHSRRRSLNLGAKCQYTPESSLVELQSADYLFVTCWCKIDSLEKLSLEIRDKKTAINIHPVVFKTDGEWKQLVFSRYIVPLDAMKNFTFTFSNQSDKRIFLDDFVFIKEAYKPVGL